jgi:anti-sigma regulatory factor (Ser/Thr protein kinase)
MAKRINIILTELLDNAIEHTVDKHEVVSFDITIEESKYIISAKNKSSKEEFEKISEYIKIN